MNDLLVDDLFEIINKLPNILDNKEYYLEKKFQDLMNNPLAITQRKSINAKITLDKLKQPSFFLITAEISPILSFF